MREHCLEKNRNQQNEGKILQTDMFLMFIYRFAFRESDIQGYRVTHRKIILCSELKLMDLSHCAHGLVSASLQVKYLCCATEQSSGSWP